MFTDRPSMRDASSRRNTLENLSDEALLRILQDPGQSSYIWGEATTEIFTRYQDPLVRYSGRFFEDLDEAKINALEALESAVFFNVDQFRPRGAGSFKRWLYRIAQNLALNKLSRIRRHPTESLEAQLESGREQPDPDEGHLFSDLENKEDEEQLQEALQRRFREAGLNEQEQLVIIYSLRGLRPREIEKVTGVPSIKVSRLLYRGKNKLK
jgi:RNA polymerase sigma factor (sigma-70 family)